MQRTELLTISGENNWRRFVGDPLATFSIDCKVEISALFPPPAFSRAAVS